MTSKESIENIKKTMIIGRHGNIDVGNKYNKEILTIEKDLEVLDILKEYLYYDNKNHVIKMKEIRKSRFNFDYEDLREWIENNGENSTENNK